VAQRIGADELWLEESVELISNQRGIFTRLRWTADRLGNAVEPILGAKDAGLRIRRCFPEPS
jgi:hypothetical protein